VSRRKRSPEAPAGPPAETLVVVLGDQLTPALPALAEADRARSVVLMCEVADETTYVPHHRKKIAFILSAMRHFAEALRADGWRVDYVPLDDPANTGSFSGEVQRAVKRHGARRVRTTEAGEWRVRQMQRGWQQACGVPVDILPDTRFVCSHHEFDAWAAGRKQLRMEYFYREMRRKTGLLMDGTEPAGGRWNFDADNRNPAAKGTRFASPPRFEPDAITRDVLALVERRFGSHVGALRPFGFAVTRAQALQALDHFIDRALPGFGDTQDAMLAAEPFLNHAVLSPYLNVGLLDPLEVCRRAEAAYRAGHAPLAAAEGFIRQIIGWREYMRGIYWREMPGYAERNFFGATRKLPGFYWTGETDMACLRAAVGQTLEHAYAHHIQRLMVTGNFALLAGIDPHEVHRWYLAVYADAFEWVELPNTLGMSQFGDGGLLASKPYAASGAYIKRMSDYCDGCRYKVARKTGAEACPFNALYWDFLARNESKLARNPRMAPMFRVWNRFDRAQKAAYRDSARTFLAQLDGG
jgi:deoxyribodipyrimidine photolyase-related protein